MFDPNNPLIIQKYVKESMGKDLRVFVVGNRIVGAMERVTTRRGEFRSNFHLGGKVLVADLSDDEKTLAVAAAKACRLDVAGVDILRTNSCRFPAMGARCTVTIEERLTWPVRAVLSGGGRAASCPASYRDYCRQPFPIDIPVIRKRPTLHR
jgi:hypothetical protein